MQESSTRKQLKAVDSKTDDSDVTRVTISAKQCVLNHGDNQSPVDCLAVLPNGHVASGSEDSVINTWDISASTCEDPLPPQLPVDTRTTHNEGTSVFCLAAMADNTIASGSSDGSIKLWRHNQCEATLLGHAQGVLALLVVPGRDGTQLLVSGSLDGTIRVWRGGCCVAIVTGHEGAVFCLHALPPEDLQSSQRSHSVFVSGSEDGTARVWASVTKDKLIGQSFAFDSPITPRTPVRAINNIGINTRINTNIQLFSRWLTRKCSSPCCVVIVRAVSMSLSSDDSDSDNSPSTQLPSPFPMLNKNVTPPPADLTPIGAMTPCPHAAHVVLRGHEGAVCCLATSNWPNRPQREARRPCWIYTGSADGSVKVWSTSGSCTATLTGHQGSVRCLQAWERDSNEAIISGGDDSVVRLWRSRSRPSRRKRGGISRDKLEWTCVTLVGHSDSVSCLGLLRGLGVLVSGSLDCSIRLWDLFGVGATSASTPNRPQATPPTSVCHEQQDAVECLCVLPASESDTTRQSVVTASQSVVLWRVRCTRT